MKPAVRIVTWYALLITPLIAVLYMEGFPLLGTMAVVAATAISIVSQRSISQLSRENHVLGQRVLEIDKMKKDFVSHVSHELKAPLASMQETTHLIIERIPGPLTEKQERLLQLNVQCGKRLGVMLGNLLDLSRLEAGVGDYEMRVQDIGRIARNVILELGPRAVEKSISLVNDLPDEPLMVMCDPNRMAQIFTNLIDNAVRFSSKGGIVAVQVSTARNPPNRAPKSVSGTNGFILIAVSDSGPGIEDPHKQGVFETFHQVKQGKKTHGQSLGLGLAITRVLVEAHEGAIWIEDNSNGGSVFFILLPGAAETASSMSRAS